MDYTGLEISDIEINHRDMVKKLMKTGHALLQEMTVHKMLLFNAGLSIGGEVGELQDALKKYLCYNHSINRLNVIEELGDIEFYMNVIREACDITRGETLASNIVKLSKRYDGIKFSNEAAKERKDKV